MSNEQYFGSEQPGLNDNKGDKSWMTTILLALFLGPLGIHRFYVGKVGTGILYLLTAGLFGIGALVDFIMILCNNFKDGSGLVIRS